jgi:hypothetical protein
MYFNSNAGGGSGTGNVGLLINFWTDVSNLIQASALPTSTDDVILQDSPLVGAMKCKNLTDAAVHAINGAAVVFYGTATAISVTTGVLLDSTNAQYLLLSRGGTLTLSDPTKTLNSNGAYGVGGTGSTPIATLPAVGQVLTTGGSWGISGSGSTGTATVPTAGNVLSGSGTYGVSGNGSTPTLTLPGITFVASPATGGPATYGVAGTGSVGTLTLTSANNAIHGSGVFGIAGTSITPNWYRPNSASSDALAAPYVDSTKTFGVGNAVSGSDVVPDASDVLSSAPLFGPDSSIQGIATSGSQSVGLNHGVFLS